MADQAALALGPGDGAGKAAPSRMATIGGVAAVTLLALAGGAGTGFLIAGDAPPPALAADAETEPAQNPVVYGAQAGPLALVPMQPVVTNIASPPSAVIRIEASLVLNPDTAGDTTLLANQVAADTLAFARSLELAQVEGARGLLHLREDLRERAMLRSPAVVDYVIHSLIAQ